MLVCIKKEEELYPLCFKMIHVLRKKIVSTTYILYFNAFLNNKNKL